ncbi:MAG: hypothetical protein QG670_2609 [Thermoproteota archaeon]|nr:hypothetical protein [Thermoproteota archaeon]
MVKNLVLGEKLWEGKGKSEGAGAIKSVGMEGITSEYSWSAQVKGMGRAKGIDGNIHVTAIMTSPPKGVTAAKDQGIFMTINGEMCVLKGSDLMKMPTGGGNPAAVGLWSFMTMSEKLGWMNDLVALVTFEALDPMWMDSNITIYEWK